MKRNSNLSKLMIAIAIIICNISLAYSQDDWEIMPSGVNSNITSIFVVPNHQEIIYAVGNNSLIIKSLDSGKTWINLTSPVACQFKTVFFINEEVGFAAGSGGYLIRTNNGGISWSAQNSNANSSTIYSIAFFDNVNGIWVGDDGKIKYTMNGGTSWVTPFNSDFTQKLQSIEILNLNHAYIVGENGLIAKTADKGFHWTTLRPGDKSYNLMDIAINQNESMLAVGTSGTALVSYDLGLNWMYVNTNTTNSLNSCEITPNGAIFYAAGSGSKIIRSDNKGIDWMDISPDSLFDINTICFNQSLNGYAAGTKGFIMRTTTGGNGDLIPSLTLTAPEENSVWVRGETLKITWEAQAITSFYISYSIDNGTSWTFIDSVSNADFYNWVVPDLPSALCKIKITNKTNDIIDILDGNFTIFRPSIRLLSPNGGEHWVFESNHDILWENAQGNNVKLEYSADNGKNWNLIIASTPSAFNKYTWTVPLNPTDSASIRVSDVTNTKDSDISNNVFKIKGIKLTSFTDGAKYLFYTNQEITWKSVGLDQVNIYYSTNNGVNWNLIASNVAASLGKYSWKIPNTPSSECLIKLIDPKNSIYNNQNNTPFTITGVLLTSPQKGDILQSGTTANILWEAANIEILGLQYTINDGAEWITINSAVPADSGSYHWIVPKANSTARLRILDFDNYNVYDVGQPFYIISDKGIIVSYPNNGDTLSVGSTYNIQWAAANVVNLNIYVSTDKGQTWTIVAENIDATLRSYSWSVPASLNGSTECQVKLTDSENSEVFGISDGLFRISDTYYQVPIHWRYEELTGANSSVVLPSNINPAINNVALQNGDAVGFFYIVNGGIKSAGYGIWNGTNLGVTVWGDNPRTEEKDGYYLNEKYLVKVWDAQNGIEYDVTCRYSSGPDFFFDNNISIISEFITHITQRIWLPGKVWSMFSSNLIPVDPDIKKIMQNVQVDMDYMKNENGEIYDPRENINNIHNWKPTHGYKIAMFDTTYLDIKGIPAIPNQNPTFLQPGNWFIISYLPQMSLDIDWALRSLRNDLSSDSNSSIVMVKNTKGEIYYPNYGINSFTAFQPSGEDGKLNPGEAYLITVNKSDTLIYPRNSTSTPDTLSIPIIKQRTQNSETKYYRPLSKSTGSSSVFVLSNDKFSFGDEVAICSFSGQIYGSASVINGKAVVTIWGDNPITTEKEGADENESLTMKYYSISNNKEFLLDIISIHDIVSNKSIDNEITYNENQLYEINSMIGQPLDLKNEIEKNEIMIYPNPAVDYISINCYIDKSDKYSVRIYNINGEKIKHISTDVIPIGNYQMEIDITNLQSGTYILKIENSEMSYSKEFNIFR